MRRALILRGGWEGHHPEALGDLWAELLRKNGFDVELTGSLDVLADTDRLKSLDLIVMQWTHDVLDPHLADSLSEAVASGVGLAGCHAGMVASFFDSQRWHFMCGGTFVAHPGGTEVEFTVNIRQDAGSLLKGLSDFQVTSEQYYVHIDPAVTVHATTRFPVATWYHAPNGEVDIPVVWTKAWGVGRVFCCTLGHEVEEFDIPRAREMMKRGLLWAGEGKAYAAANNLSADNYRSKEKMF